MKNRDRILQIISRESGVDVETITDETTLTEGLNLDSLDRVELVLELEKFGACEIDDDTAVAWQTVGDVLQYMRAG